MTGYFESIEHSIDVQLHCRGPIPFSSFGTEVLELEGQVALPGGQLLFFHTSLATMSLAKLTNPLSAGRNDLIWVVLKPLWAFGCFGCYGVVWDFLCDLASAWFQ